MTLAAPLRATSMAVQPDQLEAEAVVAGETNRERRQLGPGAAWRLQRGGLLEEAACCAAPAGRRRPHGRSGPALAIGGVARAGEASEVGEPPVGAASAAAAGELVLSGARSPRPVQAGAEGPAA